MTPMEPDYRVVGPRTFERLNNIRVVRKYGWQRFEDTFTLRLGWVRFSVTYPFWMKCWYSEFTEQSR